MTPGILSVLPIFYVGWSDSVLSPSEMQTIQALIENLPHLTEEDKKLLQSWTDQRHPPNRETFAEWKHILQNHVAEIDLSARRNLTEIGLAMAQKASSLDWYAPEVREKIEDFEAIMGLDNASSALSFYRAIVPQNASELTEEADFDPRKLQTILDGPFAELKTRTKTLLLDEAFRVPTELRNKDELRLKILEQCRYLARQGFGSYAFPPEYGGSGSTGGSTAIFETLALGNLSLLIKYGVQFGLFGGAVFQLGTEQHHRLYLEKLGKLELAGCFAMTETGHGSNVRDLETTATYDHATRSLVIHSPTEAAGKEYIGNALHSRMAAVFCQLMVNGQNHGIHTVLVPLRDENHQTLAGITVKDNGYKMGLNGVDNGRIWFDNVRVPVKNLLNRYGSIDENGQYQSPIQNPSKRFFTMLGALVGGRVSVALGSNTAAKKALDIAIRYALKRRQFKTLSEDRETLLLDYPTHQERLFPLLAKSYALTFALETLRQKFVESAALDDKREVEALAAGLKSYASWHAIDTIQECREACGGKGYLAENELPDLKADTDIFATFEGDNHVLLQLLAKSILTDFKQEFSDGGFMAVARHILHRVNTEWLESNPFAARNTNAEHLLSAEFLGEALRYREQKLLFTLSDRLRSFLGKKLNPNEIFLRTQTHSIALAMAHVERFINDEFLAKLNSLPDSPEKTALQQMQQVFALDAIHRDRGWYLENDYLSSEKSKAIRKVLTKLYRQLRPQAQAYVQAFGIPAVLRNAEIVS
ncbi:acyl-CoA dehydrogenase family protein [Runella slithyformis]|uniref:acyl-CoA oxidase n=1 Tax=Runella slithyformis (strain ATCC 29530 / DSM 19594 / LMG 11500 / NCIMB 11436 / LSU 4) TaxID=761193 RepID=A0A7U4E5Z7_RUNSL|nr:acyl-CoA dehydrogenase [Runella slithyformis]AEI48674.1 Acyl-CoA oxidase [Runella slithyformis DSM 19594]